MVNQVVLVGTVISFEEKVVDNGTQAVYITLKVESDNTVVNVPVRLRDKLATNFLSVFKSGLSGVIGIKGRVFVDCDNQVAIIGERLALIGSVEMSKGLEN
jgi:hypothetical protein